MANLNQKNNQFSSDQIKYLNAFNLIEGVGPVSLKNLLSYFNDMSRAWQAKKSELNQAGLSQAIIERIEKQKPKIDPDNEMEKLKRAKIRIITIRDRLYPRLLKEIYNPPLLLYVRGNLDIKNKPCLGVVGTRKLSAYGQNITPLLTAALVKAKLIIVSGLAKGIDSLAHQTAIKSGGQTIAVLGTGVDQASIYPYSNKYLAEKITQSGTLVSEFPLGAQPLKQHFPQRNRLISGLSLGVLVIEAPEKSGALITARNALEQNRDVFAVPGQIMSVNSQGPHNLIKMGAKLVSQASDILEELNF